MNAAELFVLGRRLIKLAEEGLPGGSVNTSGRFVMIDVGGHPGSSISEITTRTGFPQSHVSATVTRLRDYGMVRTEVDPTDRRRTLVWPTPEAMERAQSPRFGPIDGLVAQAIGNPGSAEVARVVDALELLATRLLGVGGPVATKEAS
jgi:DNA-binding MarR family transcriptional regulator